MKTYFSNLSEINVQDLSSNDLTQVSGGGAAYNIGYFIGFAIGYTFGGIVGGIKVVSGMAK